MTVDGGEEYPFWWLCYCVWLWMVEKDTPSDNYATVYDYGWWKRIPLPDNRATMYDWVAEKDTPFWYLWYCVWLWVVEKGTSFW